MAQEQSANHFSTEITVQVEMNYLLFMPEHETGQKLPLLVFLHGVGEWGDDVERVAIHGPPKIVKTKKDFPFILLSPQCQRFEQWRPEAVMDLIEHIQEKMPVDPDRIYLTGLSMGGFGCWNIGCRNVE